MSPRGEDFNFSEDIERYLNLVGKDIAFKDLHNEEYSLDTPPPLHSLLNATSEPEVIKECVAAVRCFYNQAEGCWDFY